jgi:cell division protein FtsW
MVNMAVAVNLFPVTGQTLPLVSMGGSSLLFSSTAIGIILSVSRGVSKEKEEAENIKSETSENKDQETDADNEKEAVKARALLTNEQ